MTDPLVLRMSNSERSSAHDRLARDAEHLAERTRHYADDLKNGKKVVGDAYQIAQEAIDLLRQAAFLGGMNNIGQLIE